ncbi:MAG: formate dehydrogenase subunit beta [Rhodospirillales bacterium]|nr:formate dehydrogenase subunit beta [Rhodospirillales bacterium]
MGAARTMTVVRSSATSSANAAVSFRDEVVKLIDVSKCIGCKACQAACIEWNDTVQPIGYFTGSYQNPPDLTPHMFTLMRFNEWVNPKSGELEWLIRKDGCMHCAEPGCLAACPAPGAIVQYENGIVDFVQENCIGCGYCVKGCPFDIPRISAMPAKAYKCTLCSDRVAVGDGPACAKACPTEAIVFGTKQEMLHHAAGRLIDLKSRGFAEAGLYNPGGVKGTHVMYVLPHADQPELYSNLPANPRISPWVKIWKGAATKYASLAAMAAFIVGAVVHHVASGPNQVSDKDEEEARKLIEGRR